MRGGPSQADIGTTVGRVLGQAFWAFVLVFLVIEVVGRLITDDPGSGFTIFPDRTDGSWQDLVIFLVALLPVAVIGPWFNPDVVEKDTFGDELARDGRRAAWVAVRTGTPPDDPAIHPWVVRLAAQRRRRRIVLRGLLVVVTLGGLVPAARGLVVDGDPIDSTYLGSLRVDERVQDLVFGGLAAVMGVVTMAIGRRNDERTDRAVFLSGG